MPHPLDRDQLDRDQLDGGFDHAARHYDRMVALNPGYRAHLRTAAESLLDCVRGTAPTLLDLGCGSGLSTLELVRAARRRGMTPRIIGVDASCGMLERARTRPELADVTFVHSRAEDLDRRALPPADGVLACYLLRNVTDLDATLANIRRALAAGAPLVAQDYSVRGSDRAQRRWTAVNHGIIIPLARVLTGDAGLYQYLHASVEDFCTVPELASHVHRAGFARVQTRTVGGWQRDILHLLRAS